MKTTFIFFAVLLSYTVTTKAWCFTQDETHEQWLKQRFSEQHQQLMPVVAVADIFFSCNQARQTAQSNYSLHYLIKQMDKNSLAKKLDNCLGEDTMHSSIAINFGLLACFQDQVSYLPTTEQEQKMALVKQAVSSLSYDERKKSFTQCVTEQSIHYLQ